MTAECPICEREIEVENNRFKFHPSEFTKGACAGSDLIARPLRLV